jgi:hypothetical protein
LFLTLLLEKIFNAENDAGEIECRIGCGVTVCLPWLCFVVGYLENPVSPMNYVATTRRKAICSSKKSAVLDCITVVSYVVMLYWTVLLLCLKL